MIFFMIFIGALIGGFTNYLAIKMIFRPLEPKYIGKYRLPFTPGLIPKRRGEIAKQLGLVVVNHLLTPERIKEKILDDHFQKEMTLFVQKELEKILNHEDNLEQFFEKIGFSSAKEKVQRTFDEYIDQKYDTLIEKFRLRSLKTMIPEAFSLKVEEKIPEISSFMLKKGIDYISSVEGELRIQRIVDDFVQEKSGLVGNMLQLFVGNVNMSERLQKEIIKILRSEKTKEFVSSLLKAEWEKLLNKEVGSFEEQFGEQQAKDFIKKVVQQIVQWEKLFAIPINELTKNYKDKVIDQLVPQVVGVFGRWLSEQMIHIMERLRLADVVQEQVESFSTERLEEMLLMIINKELKMITFLGALLGGLIGFIQGMIVVFIG